MNYKIHALCNFSVWSFYLFFFFFNKSPYLPANPFGTIYTPWRAVYEHLNPLMSMDHYYLVRVNFSLPPLSVRFVIIFFFFKFYFDLFLNYIAIITFVWCTCSRIGYSCSCVVIKWANKTSRTITTYLGSISNYLL